MEPTQLLSIVFGVVVGFSLGLTGGGGAIFAVPLLVYGLSMSTFQAVVISLAAVGTTSGMGLITRLYKNQVEIRTGALFAVAGMAGAPIGVYIAKQIPESMLLILFSFLMIIIAISMWRKASGKSIVKPAEKDCSTSVRTTENTCQRDAEGNLKMTSRCAMLLLLLGVITGILSGMFGIGGGFVIVPALTIFSNMNMTKAIGTSLMVIAMVSVVGVISQIRMGHSIETHIFYTFLTGCLAGMVLGTFLSNKLQEQLLLKTFSIAIVLVAVFILIKSW